jgi:hypothetical protein
MIKKLSKTDDIFSKITTDTTSIETNTSRLVPSIAEKQNSGVFTQKRVGRLRVLLHTLQ